MRERGVASLGRAKIQGLDDCMASANSRRLTCHLVVFILAGRGLLHLGRVLDGPGRHVEFVREDGEQREDVLVEERLFLLLLLRR